MPLLQDLYLKVDGIVLNKSEAVEYAIWRELRRLERGPDYNSRLSKVRKKEKFVQTSLL